MAKLENFDSSPFTVDEIDSLLYGYLKFPAGSADLPETNSSSNGGVKPSGEKLRMPEGVDNGDRRYRCQLCDRSFEKRDRLRIHMLHVHQRHRPHVCQACGKAFSQSSSLNKHQRIHTGQRPYKCVYCGRNFTASSILRTHIRQHSGEKPFRCKYCERCFASHAAHDSHVRRSHQVGNVTGPDGASVVDKN